MSRRRELAAMISVALVLGACGDSSPAESPTTAVPPPATVATVPAPPDSVPPETAPPDTAPTADGWRLVWSDEFEGEAGAPPQEAFWNHETGGEGWGNNELEYYTDRPENAALDGSGHLAIVARAEPAPDGAGCWYGACEYTSARLTTEGKVEVEYGRIEARIKVPFGQGIWPAFWMLGNNIRVRPWPIAGEIDVMENIGREPRTLHGSAHGPKYSGGSPLGGSITTSPGRLADEFHVYSVDWEPETITWRLDGRLYATASVDDVPQGGYWVFDHPFFLILNVAVGGNWPGSPDETTVFPQTMLVDWVRIWERAEAG